MDTNKECKQRKRTRSSISQNEQIGHEGSSPSSCIDYSPTIFLRCHSKTNVVVDKQTDVWQCAFEPTNSGLFATCGGNSVCVINAVDGSVKTKHYSSDLSEDFTAMAWTMLWTDSGVINILAVAGIKSGIHLLHPDIPVCFSEYPLEKKSLSKAKQNSIESLIFHPKETNILFGVFRSGKVHVWNIGYPYPPDYKGKLESLQIVHMHRNQPACALTFSTHCNMLLCATEEGAVGWITPSTTSKMKEKFKQRTFDFPAPANETVPQQDRNFVDSIEAIGDGKMIATKCARHECIYIWDLEETIKNNRKVVTPVHTLKWSGTDNYYMNIGINFRADILACGDDIGNLWLYNINEILSRPPQEHKCNKIIEWPDVQDSISEKTISERRKKDSEIVVNKVALSYDANYLVAVTSTNTVCIWKRDKNYD